MKRVLLLLWGILLSTGQTMEAQGDLNFSVDEEVRQLSDLLQLSPEEAVELRALAARFAARAGELVDQADNEEFRRLKEEKIDWLTRMLLPDQVNRYEEWLAAGNPPFASLGEGTAALAWEQSETITEVQQQESSSDTGIRQSAPPTADGMAQNQADYLDRRLQLTEEQHSRVVALYSRFNREFDRERSEQQGTDISGIQQLLRRQQAKRDRELKRILNPEQYQQYLALEGRAE